MRLRNSSGALIIPLLMAFGAVAHADDWNQETKITVNQAIEVPGAVLPAGTYIFKLMDSYSNRNIVEVLNPREDHLYATVIAIPNSQMTQKGNTVLTFYEVPAGQPQPVRAWFYPGEIDGQEFVYSKEEMQRLTQVKKTETVLAAVTPEPAPQVAEAAPAPAPAAEPAPEPAPQIAQNEAPAPPPSVETPAPTRPVMPQTASNIPLLALLGLLSVFAAAGLSMFAKRLS